MAKPRTISASTLIFERGYWEPDQHLIALEAYDGRVTNREVLEGAIDIRIGKARILGPRFPEEVDALWGELLAASIDGVNEVPRRFHLFNLNRVCVEFVPCKLGMVRLRVFGDAKQIKPQTARAPTLPLARAILAGAESFLERAAQLRLSPRMVLFKSRRTQCAGLRKLLIQYGER